MSENNQKFKETVVHSQLDFYLSFNVSVTVIVRVRGKLVRLELEVAC